MTDPSAAQLDRMAKLRDGRAAPTKSSTPKKKRRRRHAAQGSRIVAAGLGAGTMFGIVTILGLDNPLTQAEEPTPELTVPQPAIAGIISAPVAAPAVEVRVHMIPAASTVPVADLPTSVGVEPEADFEPTSATAAPIELTANPVVRTVTVAAPTQAQPQAGVTPSAPAPQPSPVATTSGSS